ncbi:MAG: response regulator [Anaerolineae bacterium]|jgi:DNA-binding response OmpR family regulator
MPSNARPATGEEVQEAPYILIVEDVPITADMLSSYFASQGYRTEAVAWGEDALALVERVVPDLVVLDIGLPDIDGYEICRQLRANERTRHVPIMFLTGKQKRSDKLKGLELGAVDYIIKPFDIQELRLRVRNLLGRSYGHHLSHPITGLPTDSLVDEQLRAILGRSDWAVLTASLRGLKHFSEDYGFIARDDVLRSVALILTHVRDEQAPDAFIGHLDTSDFLIISGLDQVESLQQALRLRVNEALSFFYPYADREKAGADLPLSISMAVRKPSAQSFEGIDDLRASLVDVQKGSALGGE